MADHSLLFCGLWPQGHCFAFDAGGRCERPSVCDNAKGIKPNERELLKMLGKLRFL